MGKADRKPPRSNRREARRDTPAVGEPRAPYAALARPAADELPEELAPHAAELGRMLSFIDLAQGFALAFAECNLERVRKSLIQVVRQRCEAAGTRVVSLDLREVPSLDAPLDVIASRLPDADEGAGKQVVMLCGLEAHVEITDPSPAALAALNMARDAFPRRLPHPLIVWLPDDLLTALSRVAPDFWAWRSATFRFPAPRPVLESVYQQAFSADARVLDAEVGEVRRRIRVLEELLQEYLPSTGKPAPDRIPGALDILNELGMAYWGLGQAARAVQYFERMLDLARLSGPRRQEARAHGNLGSAYAALGELRKAIEYHEQALRISREIGDRRVEGTAVGNLGNAYAALGEPRKAIEYYEQALRIAREIGDRRGEANALGNLGTAYADLGEARKAIEHYEQALGIAREIGDRRGEASRLGNLGNAYAALGEPRKAIEHYEQALRIAREIGDRRGEGSRLGNLGIAYAALGEPRK
ncbi:MAG: tetratricopeptide repeat protein, partial [bacterium]